MAEAGELPSYHNQYGLRVGQKKHNNAHTATVKQYFTETINQLIFTHKTYSKVVHIYGRMVKATTPGDHVSTGLQSKVYYCTEYSARYRIHWNFGKDNNSQIRKKMQKTKFSQVFTFVNH